MKKNIAVLFGGKSTEHDISIITAIQLMTNLDETKYNILPIYITENGDWLNGNELRAFSFYKMKTTKKLNKVAVLPTSNFLYVKKPFGYKPITKIDCAVLALHGINGEDGTIQGLMELSGIPYTSSGVLGSSVGLNKLAMKKMFLADKMPIVPFNVVNSIKLKQGLIEAEIMANLTYPVIVKPNRLGSSIGINVCNDFDELEFALEVAFMYDDVALVEKAITNLKEVNISVLGDGTNTELSLTEEPVNWQRFLTFEDKYMEKKNVGLDKKTRICPAKISKKQVKEIEEMAKTIFNNFECKGVVRIDFLIDKDSQKVYVNEINTIPGSFAFYLWKDKGYDYKTLLDKIINISIKQKEENKILTKFSSKVLSGIPLGTKK